MSIEIRPITSRPDWLTWRQGFLGASEIAAVAGVDPYSTALSVYAEKAGLLHGQADNPVIKRGRWLEHAAFAALREENPTRRWVQPNIFVMDDELRLACTPDVLTEDDEGGLVNCQIKCSSPRVFDEWDGEPPIGYQLQTLAEGMLLNATRNMLVVFVVDSYSARLEYFEVPRHPEAEATIRELAAKFWADMAAGRMPAPDYHRDRAAIKALYRPVEPEPIDLTTDNHIIELLEEYETAQMLAKEAKEACQRADAEITRKLNGHQKAVIPGWSVRSGIVNVKEHFAEAYEYSRLWVKRLKDK